MSEFRMGWLVDVWALRRLLLNSAVKGEGFSQHELTLNPIVFQRLCNAAVIAQFHRAV